MATTEAFKAREGFTFGCDPELFILDTERNKFVGADGLIPGTKREPYAVDGGAVQVDGMAAEFNIDPVDNFEDFNYKIDLVLSQLRSMLPKKMKLVAQPSVVFDEEEWEKAPDRAKDLGCSPDFNAWTGDVNPPPSCESEPTLRTASGHLHIGWTKDADLSDIQHIMNCRDLVKQLDWYLGGWSLSKDKDPTRRKLYGKAGACRFKDYGVEYRVLSDFWVMQPSFRLEVWNRMQAAINDMKSGYMPKLADSMRRDPYTIGRVKWNEVLVSSINTSSPLTPAFRTKFKYPIVSIATK